MSALRSFKISRENNLYVDISTDGVADPLYVNISLKSTHSGNIKYQIIAVYTTYRSQVISNQLAINRQNSTQINFEKSVLEQFDASNIDVSISNFLQFTIICTFPDNTEQSVSKSVFLNPPDLKVKIPKSISRGQTKEVVFSYTNPYKNKSLTGVILNIEADHLNLKESINISVIEPGNSINIKRPIKFIDTHYTRKQTLINGNLSCSEIKSISSGGNFILLN